jgi:hypothetical protein
MWNWATKQNTRVYQQISSQTVVIHRPVLELATTSVWLLEVRDSHIS